MHILHHKFSFSQPFPTNESQISQVGSGDIDALAYVMQTLQASCKANVWVQSARQKRGGLYKHTCNVYIYIYMYVYMHII